MADTDYKVIRCAGRRSTGLLCGNTLGVTVAGCTVVKHRERLWTGLAVTIQCELCNTIWRAADPLSVAEPVS